MGDFQFIDDTARHSVPTLALQRDGDILVGYVWELVPGTLYEWEYQSIDGNPFVALAHSKDEAMSRLASMAITLEQA